jgi:electron transport complex protein RnfC
MLITELKEKETFMPFVQGKVVMICCEGCKDVHFPDDQVAALRKELLGNGSATTAIVGDYVCNPEHLQAQLDKHGDKIKEAKVLLVFSCGVGVQTLAGKFEDKHVVAGCDTYFLPGYQGVTPLLYDCDRCGECYLNDTGGICPITACSKSLVNGQCGGAKNGKCEVDSGMECGWERIYRRLEKIGRLDNMKHAAKVRSYATDIATGN